MEGNPDVFFHITQVIGDSPPKVGDIVNFMLLIDQKTGRSKAKSVTIKKTQEVEYNEIAFSSRPKESKKNVLNGFPCIRGGHVGGFSISKKIKIVRVGKGWIFGGYPSESSVREALITKARGAGANAIVNYTWHNDKISKNGMFGKYYEDNFWAEGEAVVLVSK